MKFLNYQHIERYGNDAVQGINVGRCYIFPKIDGTQAQIRKGENGLVYGSHHRFLSLDNDNAGFMTTFEGAVPESISSFFNEYPNYILYGEWLVPHTLKTYRSDAWRKLYIFDVCEIINEAEDAKRYLSYDEYKPILEKFGIEYIPCQKIIENGSDEDFYAQLELNNYLVEDGKGAGEGVVIKNYDFRNKFGRLVYAKIVRSEFKERHHKQMGSPEVKKSLIEAEIAGEFITKAYCEKEYGKLVDSLKNEGKEWSSVMIPRLLNSIYHEFISEEMWNVVKKFKNPTVNFKVLQQAVFTEIKKHLDVF